MLAKHATGHSRPIAGTFRLPVWKLSRFESGLLGMLTYGLSRLTATHLAPKWSSEPTKMGFWYAAFCFPRVGVEMTLEI